MEPFSEDQLRKMNTMLAKELLKALAELKRVKKELKELKNKLSQQKMDV